MIYFVRHGQTDSNVNKIFPTPDVSLNEHGFEQAQQTALSLKDVKFAACYCSPFLRAKQTCDAILQYHPELVPIYDTRIQARSYGKLENQPTSSLTFNRWKVGVYDEQIQTLGMETVTDLFQRIANFFDEILVKYPNQNILVVGHSCIGRVIAGYFNGIPADNDFTSLKIPNAKVVIFDK